MTPWITVDTQLTPTGELALKQRSSLGFLITIDGRVLMNSAHHRSEAALGALGCRGLTGALHPRVLLGGLGMAFTLRAVLDALGPSAEVLVAELNPVVVSWCRGPLAHLTGRALDDPRVSVRVADVAEVLREASVPTAARSLDAIILDLYVGPDGDCASDNPLYGSVATERAFAALKPDGVLAVWAETYHQSYQKRLERSGFAVTRGRQSIGRSRFVIYLATRA